MKPRKYLPSLKSRSTELLVQLSINALRRIFDEVDDLNCNKRKWKLPSKRKRSYSCDDNEQGRLRKKGKLFDIITHERSNKRKRDSDDSDNDHSFGMENKMKKQRLDKKFETPRKIDVHKKIKDDISVIYDCSQNDTMQILKRYISNLPNACWGQYSNQLIEILLREIKIDTLNIKTLKKVIDLVFCEKLVNFTTKSIEGYEREICDTFYNHLKFCRNLLSLEISFTPISDNQVIKCMLALQKFKHLQSLQLVPSVTKYSYHWVFNDIAQNCPKLRELKILYDGDKFSGSNNISVLKSCQNLIALWLFNYGRKSETRILAELLGSLKKVKVLFHKELPNAILDLNNEAFKNESFQYSNSGITSELCCLDSVDYIEGSDGHSNRNLNLERLDLCWHQETIGYQLVYVPSSYLLRVALTCPKMSLINLVGSMCLFQMIKRLPHLQAIVLQQTSFSSSLRCTFKDNQQSKLTVLRLSDVWDITYDMISQMAMSCPNLQVLSISCSSIESRGRLLNPSKRPPFSNLRHLTLVPGPLEGRPPLTAPTVWQLGTALTKYILQETKYLAYLHINYVQDHLDFDDTPTEADLVSVLCVPRPELEHLTLEWPPAISENFVRKILDACPNLENLGSITTWPLDMDQCANLITSFSSFLDVS